MASFVLSSSEKFPPGTDVTAYRTANWQTNSLPPAGSPPGLPDASTTISGSGSATFTGLVEGVDYYVHGQVGGEHRYIHILTDMTVQEDLAAEGKGFVNHGAVAGTDRPTGFASVEWVGSVEPTNAENGDTWINTS